MTLTANDKIQRRTIEHGTYIQRYGDNVVRRMHRLLAATEQDLIDQLNLRLQKIITSGADLGPYTSKRMLSLLDNIKGLRKEAFDAITSGTVEDLLAFTGYESEFQYQMLKGSIPADIGLTVARPAIEQVRSAAMSRPFQGRHLRAWYRDIEQVERKEIKRHIKLGVTSGETLPQITARVGRALNTTNNNINGIVRTAVNHISNRARQEVGRANSDVISGIKIIATLDTSTSPICRDKDSNILPVGSLDLPPYHIGCRTTFIYILKSWKELGFDFDELPEGARASMDGAVPAKMSYWQWLKEHGKELDGAGKPKAIAALGKVRGNLFLRGKVSGDKFRSKSGEYYNIDELAKRENITLH